MKKDLKAKVREFDAMIKTNFLGNGVPKENMHYTCIACITIDSVMRIDKKNHPQACLEECKYRIKKIQMPRFINTELKSDSDSEPDSEVESKSDTELMAKLKSDSDSEQVILVLIIFTHTFLLTLNKSFYCSWRDILNLFLFMYIFLREQFFSQVLFQTYFLLALKIHKQFDQFN